MSSPRLRAQFEKLFEHYNGKDSGVQLDDITEILFCTRRNARIVLNKLEEEGWIEWHPAAGRGNLSQLIFKRNRQDVSENLARKYLEEGKIGQALSVLDQDANKLTQVIQGYLGFQHHEGEQVIRLPYYRQLSMLNPRKPHRRSEQHIIRQIFSGLTRLDENDVLKPDLAHSWEAINARHWRFYIRNGVRYHNGNLLKTEHVLESLKIVSANKYLSHIDSVSSPSPWVVDIRLSSDDWHLPLFLSEASAKIVPPAEYQGEEFDLLPVGTGPYRVIKNDEKRLILEAFDGYFGFRPLIDKVEVWVIDESFSTLVYPSLSNPIRSQNSGNNKVELDPGCTYLMLNRKNGIFKDDLWAEYICSALSSFNLFRHISDQTVIDMGLLPAHGLKPGWQHSLINYKRVSPPGKQKITLAHHAEHPLFPALAKTIVSLLNADGISVDVIKYQHTLDNPEQVDLWIKPMGIGTNRDDALAGWLLDYSDIDLMSNEEAFEEWQYLIESWRSKQNKTFPAQELGKSLVGHKQIIPMFHCWLGVSTDHCGSLQNAKCNALGWFDFSEVWVRPDLSDS